MARRKKLLGLWKAEERQKVQNPALEYLKNLGSPASVSATRSRLTRLALWMGYQGLEDCPWFRLRCQHVSAFLDTLKHPDKLTSRHQYSEKALRASTINGYLFAIKGVSKISWGLGLINDHDYLRIKSVKPLRAFQIPKGRSITFSESKVILDVCSAGTSEQIRDKAILMLLLGAGLRRAEIINIKINDVHFDTSEILIHGKGNKERNVTMIPEVKEAVCHWMTEHQLFPNPKNQQKDNEDEYLFCRFTRNKKRLIKYSPMHPVAIWRIVNKYVNAATEFIQSVKDIKTHDFRRTFATRLFEQDVDISTIRGLMGHSNISTTARYDKRGEQAGKKAMLKVKL